MLHLLYYFVRTILINGENFVALKTNTKISKADKIEPAPEKAYNANDSAEMYEWTESLDITKLQDKIKKYTFLSSLFGAATNNLYGSYHTTIA